MDRFQRSEKVWERVVAESGRPAMIRHFSDAEVATAAREQRVLRIETWRDGFGGGRLFITQVASDGADPTVPVPGHDPEDHLRYWDFVVFPRPVRLTDAERDLLHHATVWENLDEIPHVRR